MKTLLSTTILLLVMMGAMAQTSSIRGKVVDNSKNPLVGVNVVLKENQKGVQTDFDGTFNIKTSKGKFTLVLSYIGFKTKEILVTAPMHLSEIILYEGNEILSEVFLTSKNNKFSRKKTAYVSKLPLKDLENSQVYSTVTSKLLASQVVTNIDDALNNATGISKLWEATGRAPGEGTGYFSTRGFATQPQLVDGMPGFTLSAVDPSYIERIEVVKGPSATLFGSTSTSLGGLINIVTKKPFEGFGGSVSYTAGSFGTHRVSADINTSLSEKGGPYFRLNTSYLTQDSFQDAGFKKTFFVAPSVSYRVHNRLNLSFGFEYARTRQTNPSMLFVNRLGEARLSSLGIPNAKVPKNIHELNVDPNKSFTSDDIYLTSPTFNTRAIIDYKISDKWTSQSVFASSYSEANGYYQYNIDGGAIAMLQLGGILQDPRLASLAPLVQPMLLEATSLLQNPAFTRIFEKRDANATNYNIQQNFIGDFKIGSLRNRFVAGLDFVNRSQFSKNQSGNPAITKSSNFPQLLGFFADPQSVNPAIPDSVVPILQATGQQIANGFNSLPYFDAFLTPQGTVINSTFTPGATYATTRNSLDQIFNQIPVNYYRTNSKVYAAYISDVLNITQNLTINLGLRLDHFEQNGGESTTKDDYTKTTLSPKAGVVYQPIPNKLSLFGNYQTGFINVDPIINRDTEPSIFEPIKAKQFEGGIKTNLFNNRLNLGASYYHIIANNKTTTDPEALLATTQIDLKEIVSKGVELEMNANPFTGLNLRASYAYNDSQITDAYSKKAKRTNQAGALIEGVLLTELQGRRPEEAGPKMTYNFWADYKFQEDSFLKNIGIGAGLNGASEHLTVNNATAGTFTLPSYTIYNASIYYDAKKFTLGFKVNNLTDQVYYKGWTTVNAQAPRAFLGTLSYKF
ncbi:TonB-dependent outer membrane receptor. Probable siderophore-iron transporter [Tenacibaculum maritimum]|uniref:TonB-dependent receptor n=1 Tax=Tenacibaculum maritimum TaxID=107401 RepID=UPI0012E53964|nr:TonB-dependent receptor [Tenacibaculum maritimum]CAA0187330.1 TonB-dependent outer membrane receptor. Probable siderophore-iron transporter [Tenacibaculum maritimum]